MFGLAKDERPLECRQKYCPFSLKAHLCVLYHQVSRRQNHGYKRCREEHFNNRDAAIIAAEDPGKRVGVEDTESPGCANSQAAMILVERHKVQRWA